MRLDKKIAKAEHDKAVSEVMRAIIAGIWTEHGRLPAPELIEKINQEWDNNRRAYDGHIYEDKKSLFYYAK